MADYLETIVSDGGSILIEVETYARGTGFGKMTEGERARKAEAAFGQALDTIRLAATSVIKTLGDVPERPDDVRVEFGIKFDAEAGAMLARGPDAQLKVSLAWRREPEGKEEK